MINAWFYTESKVKGDEFLRNTGNRYELVAQRPYTDKKGKLPNGIVGTFHILEDSGDYGIDKNTGKPRSTNKGQNFDATILCGTQYVDIEQGTLVSLEGFDAENSFAIGFDLLLRFKGIRKVNHNQQVNVLQQQGGSNDVKKLIPKA